MASIKSVRVWAWPKVVIIISAVVVTFARLFRLAFSVEASIVSFFFLARFSVRLYQPPYGHVEPRT